MDFNVKILLSILFLSVLFFLLSFSSLSCEKKCCKGQNPSCFTYDKRTGEKCFCDTSCYRTKDCCEDFQKFCVSRNVKCILSNWTPWSPCSRNCGNGLQIRKRKILFNYYGKKCGHTEESKMCYSVLCPVQIVESRKRKTVVHPKVFGPTARIVPDFGNMSDIYKKYNPKYDVRQHLYENSLFHQNFTEKPDHSYCAYYQMKLVFGTCNKIYKLKPFERKNWHNVLKYFHRNRKICVTCNLEFQQKDLSNQCKGTGILNKMTRWRAIRSDNCHGYFKLISRKENCVCSKPSFIMI